MKILGSILIVVGILMLLFSEMLALRGKKKLLTSGR